MTLLVLLRTNDGLVAAADPRAAATSAYAPDDVRRLGPVARGLVLARTLADRVFVGAAGSLGMLQALEKTLDGEERDPGLALETLLPRLQEQVVQLRAAGLQRYRTMYTENVDARILPTMRLLLAESRNGQPRIVYMSESGDLEDRTAIGYDVLGSGDLYGHLHLRQFPPGPGATATALVIAHTIVADAAETPALQVSAPPLVWKLETQSGRWTSLGTTEIDNLESARGRFQKLTQEALLQASLNPGRSR